MTILVARYNADDTRRSASVTNKLFLYFPTFFFLNVFSSSLSLSKMVRTFDITYFAVCILYRLFNSLMKKKNCKKVVEFYRNYLVYVRYAYINVKKISSLFLLYFFRSFKFYVLFINIMYFFCSCCTCAHC